MNKLFISIAFLSLGLMSYAQDGGGKLKKATKDYEGYSYSKAIERYVDAADGSIESQRNLATAYFRVGDINSADSVYNGVVNMDGATAEDYYMYASILQQNEKYPESETWMSKFNATQPNDSRGKGYVSSKGYFTQLLKDKGQFSIKNLDINSAQEDFSPVYFQDKVLFASSREGVKPIRRKWNWNNLPFLDVYQAEVGDKNELSNPTTFRNLKINKKYHEGPVCFNADETTMIFTRNNYQDKSLDKVIRLQMFTSKLVDGEWQKEEAFPHNASSHSVGHASISNDGKWLYFASDMPGGIGGVDIYKCAINEDGTYGTPINLGDKINTEGNEMFPSIHANGMLFFSSNGLVGLGGLDLFVAQVKEDLSIGKVMNLGYPVNSNKDDFSLILDKEAKSGYFASNRSGGHGDDDIYSFNLLKPFTFGKVIKGTVSDLATHDPLPGATIILENSNRVVIDSTIADENGNYEFLVNEADDFVLKAIHTDYFQNLKPLSKIDFTDEEFIVDIDLEKDPGLSMYAIVTDKKTGRPLEGVSMTITDNLTGKSVEHLTDIKGDYLRPLTDKKINDKGSYTFILEKAGYFSKAVTYNELFDHEGQYDVHASLDQSMDPEVADFSQMIQINPINFDFNKYNIRPDAAIELDKIVAIMNKYPGMVIELGAHTDCRGSAAYNEKLSDRRAKATADYIAARITNPERIYGKGYGENRLLEDCNGDCKSCSDEQHDANRRTEFKVISTGNDAIKVNNSSTDSFDE